MQHRNLNNQNIKTLISLSHFTTLKVGGPAECLAEPNTIKEIQELIMWSKKNDYACQIIGAGSNLLINDNILKGLTIDKNQDSEFSPEEQATAIFLCKNILLFSKEGYDFTSS